jgi:hypothetical protein
MVAPTVEKRNPGIVITEWQLGTGGRRSEGFGVQVSRLDGLNVQKNRRVPHTPRGFCKDEKRKELQKEGFVSC